LRVTNAFFGVVGAVRLKLRKKPFCSNPLATINRST
jgi:hypothetical protein